MWHFLHGYVIIEVQGLSVARFLRRMTDAGVRVSNLTRLDAGAVRFTIPARRFFELRRLKRGLGLKLHIVGRGGLPFLTKKLFGRPFLWAFGTLLFFGLLFVSSRIWVIRIGKTERVDPEEIVSLLNDHGLYPGSYPDGPILITAANDLSAQIRDASWIGLDREGVVLNVRVVESLPAAPKKTTRVPSDVIAQKDGIVTSILVMRGQAKVKVGDRVSAGDVLISGTVFRKDEHYETNADGTVTAALEYRAEAPVTDRVTETVETGASERVQAVRFASFEILRTEPGFERYRLTDTEITSVSDLLPVTIERSTARELTETERLVTEEEAEENAFALARERALALVPRDASVLNIYGTVKTKDGGRIAVVIVTAEETIGRTEEEPHDR